MAAEAVAVLPDFAPVTLEGRWLRLEPLAPAHLDALAAAASDPGIFAYYALPLHGREGMSRFFKDAFRMCDEGTGLPFAQIERASNRPVGSTRFGAIDRRHRRAEIGWTWLEPRCQRTPLNTESKYMLLRHAFETLGLIRVEFKTDLLNENSRRALRRIGAVEEGIFRKHMVMHTGRIRDSVYYSITDDEWPAVKLRLEELLTRPFASRPQQELSA
jgi:RimJ/RimL family protein N-acetyltransferase